MSATAHRRCAGSSSSCARAAEPGRLVAPPLCLYIHIPYCVRKCPYCDFNSHALDDGAAPEEDYAQALLRDLAFEAPLAHGRPVESIFFGGGTPSVLSPAAIGRILDAAAARLRLAPGVEITLEANPGTVDQARFAGYRTAGVNRLSLGIQSFDGASLRRLGRIHGRHEALAAIDSARRAGFDNINLDLMFALPGQDLAKARADIELACSLAPPHISYYQLTLEPGTAFFHRPPTLPGDELAWEMQQQGQALLAAHGYRQYEVSAYAVDGRQCHHNRNYWRFGDYLGVGAGAHGKLTEPDADRITRRARVRVPQRYLQHAGRDGVLAEQREVTRAERRLEFALNALRLRSGFDVQRFEAATGLPASAMDAALGRAAALGLVERRNGEVRASELGWRHLNTLIELFM